MTNVTSVGIEIDGRFIKKHDYDDFSQFIESIHNVFGFGNTQIVLVTNDSEVHGKILGIYGKDLSRLPTEVMLMRRRPKRWSLATAFAERAIGDKLVWMSSMPIEWMREVIDKAALSEETTAFSIPRSKFIGHSYAHFNRHYFGNKISRAYDTLVAFSASRGDINGVLGQENDTYDMTISLAMNHCFDGKIKIISSAETGSDEYESTYSSFYEINALRLRYASPYIPTCFYIALYKYGILGAFLFELAFLVSIVSSVMLLGIEMTILSFTAIMAVIIVSIGYDIMVVLRQTNASASGKSLISNAHLTTI